MQFDGRAGRSPSAPQLWVRDGLSGDPSFERYYNGSGYVPTRNLWFRQRLRRCRTREVALEPIHVHYNLVSPPDPFSNLDRRRLTLFGTRVWLVYPVPCADAFAVRARGHIRRDLEMRVEVPHACVLHAEYHKVLRLDIIGI